MEIRILDENFISVEVITDYESLTWTKKWLTVGEFQLVVSDSYSEVAATAHNPLAIRYVWRTDSDYIGRIDNVVYEDGMIVANGYFLEELLAFRSENRHNINYSGNVESVVRDIVNQNCIINKPIEKLTLGTNKNIGETITATLFGRRVIDCLAEISTVHNCSYKIKYDIATEKLIFNVLWGKDRTQEQVVNDWCLFGRKWGNVYTEKFETNTNYANYATVWGSGEGTARISEIVDIRKPSEELREISVDARDLQQGTLTIVQYRKTLYDRGIRKLSEQGKYENIFADVEVSPEMPYNLGDTISYVHEVTRKVFYLTVTEEKEIFEGNSIKKKISFGERQGGVMSAIKTGG